MARIELILLDFDGTLADTRRANALAYKQALAEAGYRLDEEEYAQRWFGMRCGEFLRSFGIADPEQIDRLRLRKIALYPSFFDTVRLIRPLWEFCQAFRADGTSMDRLDRPARQHRPCDRLARAARGVGRHPLRRRHATSQARS